MRYPQDHNEKARRRIISVAAREYRRRGISRFGVGDAMRGAGLTQGAFYSHFSSKEELVKEALHEAMTGSPVLLEGRQGHTLKEIVSHYLEAEHRDHPESGCPAPSLIEEVARHPKKTREGFISDLEAIISLIESRLPKSKTAATRHQAAFAIFSTLIGAIQLARVTPDPGASNMILEAARDAALRLAEV
jgi:TetR/AcrR family transcriptional repressor of nem operon